MRSVAAAILAILLLSCDRPAPSATPESLPSETAMERAVIAVKALVDADAERLVRHGEALCAAAPAPDEDGWNAVDDAAAVGRMRAAWRRLRNAYEGMEGAVQILFPQLDLDLDGRLEHYAEMHRESDPFDDRGFVGMHAIERVLWADDHTPEVQSFERALLGYMEPRTPRDADEARTFVDGLCGRLVRDARALQSGLAPLALDAPTAWRGILGSLEEQAEKVLFAATGQTESRYARQTLADMRANLAGGRAFLEAYDDAMREHAGAEAARPEIVRGLEGIAAAYEAIEGDALPPAPADFDPDADDSDSEYGRLHGLLSGAIDPRAESSLARHLRAAGESMGVPPLAR